MHNTTNANKKVFYLTEGDIREIVSECTAAVLNEGVGKFVSKIGRGLVNLAKKRIMKKVYKGENMGHKAIDYRERIARKHWPSPESKYVRYASKITPPEVVRRYLWCCPRESEVLYTAYKWAYENKHLRNTRIPGFVDWHVMTYGEFMDDIIITIEQIYHNALAEYIYAIERKMKVDRFNDARLEVIRSYVDRLEKLAAIAAIVLASLSVKGTQQQVNNNHKFSNR